TCPATNSSSLRTSTTTIEPSLSRFLKVSKAIRKLGSEVAVPAAASEDGAEDADERDGLGGSGQVAPCADASGPGTATSSHSTTSERVVNGSRRCRIRKPASRASCSTKGTAIS